MQKDGFEFKLKVSNAGHSYMHTAPVQGNPGPPWMQAICHWGLWRKSMNEQRYLSECKKTSAFAAEECPLCLFQGSLSHGKPWVDREILAQHLSETLRRSQSLVFSQNRLSHIYIFWTWCQATDTPHILSRCWNCTYPFPPISERSQPLSSAWYQFVWKPSNTRKQMKLLFWTSTWQRMYLQRERRQGGKDWPKCECSAVVY